MKNEITSIPKILKLLELKGCVVTIDAMGCQKDIAKDIISLETDYLLAGQSSNSSSSDTGLHKHLMLIFEGYEIDFTETFDKGHRRLESRRCWVGCYWEYIWFTKLGRASNYG